MSPQIHALVGTCVLVANLVVGLWALVAWRRGRGVGLPLTIGLAVALALLVIQILLGINLWLGGGRPGGSPVAQLHIAAPVLAAIMALGIIADGATRSPKRYAIAALLMLLAALVSYVIGEVYS